MSRHSHINPEEFDSFDELEFDLDYQQWSAAREAEYIASIDAQLAADEQLSGVECSTYRRYSVGDALFNPFA